MRAGAADFIEKPVGRDELLASIDVPRSNRPNSARQLLAARRGSRRASPD